MSKPIPPSLVRLLMLFQHCDFLLLWLRRRSPPLALPTHTILIDRYMIPCPFVPPSKSRAIMWACLIPSLITTTRTQPHPHKLAAPHLMTTPVGKCHDLDLHVVDKVQPPTSACRWVGAIALCNPSLPPMMQHLQA